MLRAGDDGAALAMLRALAGRCALDDAALSDAMLSLAQPAALIDTAGVVRCATEAARVRAGVTAGCDWFAQTASERRQTRLRQAYARAMVDPSTPIEHAQRIEAGGYGRIVWHYVVRRAEGGSHGALVFGSFHADPPWDPTAVLQLAGDAIFIADPAGRFVMLNERACDLVGYSRGALLGLDFTALLDPEELRAKPLRVAELRAARSVVVERSVVHRDGTRVPVEIGATLLPGGYVQAIVRDLRPRRDAADALRRSEAILRAVTEHLPDIVVVHREGRVVYVNPAAARAWDQGEGDGLVGRSVLDLVHPDERPVVAARVKAMLSEQGPVGVHLERLLRKDGSTLLAEVAALPVEFDGHRCIMAVARDVTEIMAMRARLSQADRMASVGLLAAGVAHEINNPLTYVLLNLERLGAQLAAAEHATWAAWAEEAADGARRVQKIVRDLRTFARADDEREGPVALAQVIDTALQLSASALRFRARVVRTQVGPPAWVVANEGRLLQVFVNLLVNAAHALADGDPDRDAVYIDTAVAEGRVRVQVRDTGRGIPADHLPRLFEPFFTTKPVGEGSGLGLWISHNIVTAAGGRIEVESEVGVGSTFTVELPCAGEGALAERRASDRGRASTTPPRPPVGGDGATAPTRRRVLLVDDEPMILTTLAALLSADYDVVTAGSGGAARDLLQHDRRFDAVLCDLMMAEVTGMDLHRGLAALDPGLAGRMVFMTGGAFTDAAERFLTAVPNPRVVKPFELPELLAILGRVARAAPRSVD